MVDENLITIRLTFPYPADQEGDLALQAFMNGKPMQIISFSILPGPLVGEADAQILFGGRVQGIGPAAVMRHATRFGTDITPCALLMAALEGVTRLKRAFKARVSDDVEAYLHQHCLIEK